MGQRIDHNFVEIDNSTPHLSHIVNHLTYVSFTNQTPYFWSVVLNSSGGGEDRRWWRNWVVLERSLDCGYEPCLLQLTYLTLTNININTVNFLSIFALVFYGSFFLYISPGFLTHTVPACLPLEIANWHKKITIILLLIA